MAEVMICEMGPRDGLQFLGARGGGEPRIVSPALRVRLVEQLVAAGLPFIEVGAFVSQQRVPQMAETDKLCARLGARGSTWLAALVPNLKHYERFRASGLNALAVFLSASEAYSRANVGMSIDEALANARQVVEAAQRDFAGRALHVRAHVSAAFQEVGGDGGRSDVAQVVRLCDELLKMGCACVALADTKGTTNPRRVEEVLREVGRRVGLEKIGVHLHDRTGCGLANALAAWQQGVRIFDASVGGVGGTYVPSLGGAGEPIPGNIATEELVAMLESMGVSTGIDQGRLLEAARVMYEITVAVGEERPPSKILRERMGRNQ